MRLDKLTSKFQQALQDAQSTAVGHDNSFIEPVHLLKALLEPKDSTGRYLLTRSGANLRNLDEQLDKAIDRLPQVSGVEGEVHLSND
ncbi:MAG: Clp protease N-terminal domain-containing protein, partial [Gammaproteobacteria bacterium]